MLWERSSSRAWQRTTARRDRCICVLRASPALLAWPEDQLAHHFPWPIGDSVEVSRLRSRCARGRSREGLAIDDDRALLVSQVTPDECQLPVFVLRVKRQSGVYEHDRFLERTRVQITLGVLGALTPQIR